jgi:hypothetical protein
MFDEFVDRLISNGRDDIDLYIIETREDYVC